MTISKHASLKEAKEQAKKNSIETPNTFYYVIESADQFYIDTSSYVRKREILHASFVKIIVK